MALLYRKLKSKPEVTQKASRTQTEHDRLVLKAGRWLGSIGCGSIVTDPWRTPMVSESPDAIGWRDGLSVLVEVKTSRSDFLADRKKPFRMDPANGMGDWRFYLAPLGLIDPNDIPEGWGLIEVGGKTNQIKNIHNLPPNTCWHSDRPFYGNKTKESVFLSYALKAAQAALRTGCVVPGIK